MPERRAIPGALNLTVLGATILVAAGALWTASHAGHWLWIGLAALVFSFAGNTLYAPMHRLMHQHEQRMLH